MAIEERRALFLTITCSFAARSERAKARAPGEGMNTDGRDEQDEMSGGAWALARILAQSSDVHSSWP